MIVARYRHAGRIVTASSVGACVCLALLGGACGGGSSAPTSTTTSRIPGDYINEILALMQDQAIHRARINWTDFRARVTGAAQGAQTIPELYPAISLALGMLEDRHSFYVATSGSFVGNPGSPRCAPRRPRSSTSRSP